MAKSKYFVVALAIDMCYSIVKEVIKLTLGERLVKVRAAQSPKQNQSEFAESIGMTRSAYSMYEIDRVTPSESTLKLIALTYRINYDWLLTGEGDQYVEADTVEQAVDRFMANASEFQRNTFKALAGMGDDQWIWLEKLVDSIAGQKKGD